MDQKRIRIEKENMKLATWLANNIIEDSIDVDTIEDFIVSGKATNAISEANKISSNGGEVDDGPTTYYTSYKKYKKRTNIEAQKLGMQVLDYIIGEKPKGDFSYSNTNMPTFYPAGIPGESTPTHPKDYTQAAAYKKWKKRIKPIALSVGYKYLDFLNKKDIPKKSPDGGKIKEPIKEPKNPLTEAVKNKYAFKAIFLAGGPGSGKSSVINKLFGIPPKGKLQSGLTRAGLKVVNSDSSFEYLKAKHKIPPSENDMTDAQRSTGGKLMARSVKIAKKQLEMYLESKLGIIIDGTAASSNALGKKKAKIEELGYDCYMIFVSTSLETALERNRNRPERTLLDKVVERVWKQVMDAVKTYKSMFGSNFVEVSTEGPKTDSLPPGVQSGMSRFLNKAPKNKTAVKWLKHARELL
jgi:predicted kinase